MKKFRLSILFCAALALCLISGAAASSAADGVPPVSYTASDFAQRDTTVLPQNVDGTWYLFLPSSADLTGLLLRFTGSSLTVSANGKTLTVNPGETVDLAILFPTAPADGKYPVTLTLGSQRTELTIMRSANLRSMHITSADAEKGREWVELDKDNKAKGNAMVLLRADGDVVFEGTLKDMKGRGNSTWNYPKKPYQIKLKDAFDLLETGDAREAEATWVLLANYVDGTLIRNSITYDLAAELGMAYSPNCKFVDLYYDGQYRGTYLLSEKTEVGAGRVDIADLEAVIEDANPAVDDFDDLDTKIKTRENGRQYQYVTGLNTPAGYSGGYLLELDFTSRARAEKSWFATSSGQYVVCKSPEYLPEAAMDYISTLYQEFEDAVFNGGVHPVNGRSYTSYVDLESLATHYLILELAQNGDAFLSSTYFYKPAGEDKLYAGPVWDYDSSYGGYYEESGMGETGFVAGRTSLGLKLLSIPSFQQTIRNIYTSRLNGLVDHILLGSGSAAGSVRLRSILSYAEECSASQRMDNILWHKGQQDYAANVEGLRQFLSLRNRWLYGEVSSRSDYSDVAGQFADIPSNAWYGGSVAYVVNAGLFNGTSRVLFSPDLTLTRGMAVTILYRMAGQPAVTGSRSFSDVRPDEWYTNAVLWAAEQGIAEADRSSFGVNDPITRSEMVLLFYRYAGCAGMDTAAPAIPEGYTDKGILSSEEAAAFGWAIAEGIIKGVGGEALSLSPKATCDRAQTAAIIQRFHQLTVK